MSEYRAGCNNHCYYDPQVVCLFCLFVCFCCADQLLLSVSLALLLLSVIFFPVYCCLLLLLFVVVVCCFYFRKVSIARDTISREWTVM